MSFLGQASSIADRTAIYSTWAPPSSRAGIEIPVWPGAFAERELGLGAIGS
jgi:hypothetical protein